MAGPDRRFSTGVGRRDSIRYSTPINEDDDEDYALAAMGISDGFRPSDLGHNRMSSQTSQHQDRPQSTRAEGFNGEHRRAPPPVPPPRPSSTTKPNSFALRHDGAMGPIPTRNSAIASTSNQGPSRSSSISTDVPLRVESPYHGPTGPSHPYQMYPQESRLARTASMAMTATVPVQESSYTGPARPTHPYGMYPQNTVPETESIHGGPVAAPVPVGFPGSNNDYQRRLGPEGEEIADIIGPDGHTEQLPPYTKYPDEAFARKTRPMVQLAAEGAGGLGLATRNPEFASREDLNSPNSRQSTRSLASDIAPQISTAAAAFSEKPELKNWQKFAKRKVCGIIPLWAISLVAFVLIIFGIVLGSVFAALKPRNSQRHPHSGGNSVSVVITTMTATFDATPITIVPTGLTILPTGTYILPITAPSTVQNTCIESTLSPAWACNIQSALPYQMEIDGIPNGGPLSDKQITLSYGNHTIDFLPYGAQPPVLTQAHALGLVTDSQNPERGPAWFFQTLYNKVVIVPENALQPPSTSKRGYTPKPSDFMGRKGVAQAGDKPWLCYWNGTLLESFIYANQTSAWGRSFPSSSSSTTATPTNDRGQSTSNSYGSSPSSSTQSSSTAIPSFLPGYPKVVKLEERRVPRGFRTVPPYCVQQVVNGDGSYQPFLNSDGHNITIYLDETDPSSLSPISDRSTLLEKLEERDTYLRERDSSNQCGCVWLST